VVCVCVSVFVCGLWFVCVWMCGVYLCVWCVCGGVCVCVRGICVCVCVWCLCVSLCMYLYIYVRLEDWKRSLSGKKDHSALWHYRNSHNSTLRVVAVFKQPQRVVTCDDMPQREMSFKWTVYKFSYVSIKYTCCVGLMENNGETHFFLQQLLEWHIELHFIFFERHLHFISMQYLLQWQLTNPSLLPGIIIEADRRDSELEGTSCASKLSAVVNWSRACIRSSRPSFVPNR